MNFKCQTTNTGLGLLLSLFETISQVRYLNLYLVKFDFFICIIQHMQYNIRICNSVDNIKFNSTLKSAQKKERTFLFRKYLYL